MGRGLAISVKIMVVGSFLLALSLRRQSCQFGFQLFVLGAAKLGGEVFFEFGFYWAGVGKVLGKVSDCFRNRDLAVLGDGDPKLANGMRPSPGMDHGKADFRPRLQRLGQCEDGAAVIKLGIAVHGPTGSAQLPVDRCRDRVVGLFIIRTG